MDKQFHSPLLLGSIALSGDCTAGSIGVHGVKHSECVRVVRSGQPSVWPAGGLVFVYVCALICEYLLMSGEWPYTSCSKISKCFGSSSNRYRWIEIQRQENSGVFVCLFVFLSGLNWSCLLLQPVCCCCQVISVRLPSVCILPPQLYCFSPATILHGCTHSPAQPPDAVSDSLVLASSHTYSQGVVKVGFSLLTVIASGGPDCTWVGWIEQAATGWWNLPTASLPGNEGRWWRDRRIPWVVKRSWTGECNAIWLHFDGLERISSWSIYAAADILVLSSEQGVQSGLGAIFVSGSNCDIVFFSYAFHRIAVKESCLNNDQRLSCSAM